MVEDREKRCTLDEVKARFSSMTTTRKRSRDSESAEEGSAPILKRRGTASSEDSGFESDIVITPATSPSHGYKLVSYIRVSSLQQ